MSTSEQEVQSQVAEMRQALRSAAASRRIAKLVSILAVIVGLGIVAYVVWQVFDAANNLMDNPEELQAAANSQIELLNLDRKATEIIEKATPAYTEQIQRLFLEDEELQRAVAAELDLLREEVKPIIQQELIRIRPRVEDMLEQQADKTLQSIEGTLEQMLSDRLASIMEDKTGELAGQVDMSPERLAEIAERLQNGLQGAVKIVWNERAEELWEEMRAINELVAQIPERDPELSPDEAYKDITLVLVALLKEELPEYDTSGLKFAPTGGAPAGRPGSAQRGAGGAAVQIEMPDLENVPEEQREAVRQQIEQARQAAQAAAGDEPAAGEGGQR